MADYTDKAAYEAAHAEWVKKKQAGEWFPGPEPRYSPVEDPGDFGSRIAAYGGSPTLGPEAQALMQSIQRMQAQPAHQNPYNLDAANAATAGQLALLAQMRQQGAGPSLAAMQGQQGSSQLGQQSLMRGGRAGMLGAQGASAGMAADVGRARLAEALRMQAGLGSVAGGLEGRGLAAQQAHQQAGLRMQGIDLGLQNALEQQRQQLQEAAGRAGLEYLKQYQTIGQEAEKNVDRAVSMVPIAGALMPKGGGK